MQAKLALIGATIGFRVWIPKPDRSRVLELVPAALHAALLDKLPLSYDLTTLETIELIDVIWIRGRSIIRAFEVEHTTSVYSGLLRMADLLALQPNMDIRLQSQPSLVRHSVSIVSFHSATAPEYIRYAGRSKTRCISSRSAIVPE